MLEIKNITKKYNDKIILNNVNLCVKRQEVAILLGSSGVGKSSLLRILNNLESYDHGSVYLDNKKLDLKEINNKHISGMVFQQFNLFKNLNVLENITFALEKSGDKNRCQAKNIAHNLLKKYNLEDKALCNIDSLSGGQKQRLSIARTLALKPKIICLDEPTSALDPLLTTSIANNIKELAQEDHIVLIATHDVSLLDKIDATLYLLDKGTIIEYAYSQDFFKNQNQYPALKSFISGYPC